MKKKLFIFIFITLSFMLFAAEELTTEEIEWLSNHKTIRIAPDPDFHPIEFIDENGIYGGIASEFMNLVSKELDIEFEVVPCKNWEDVLQKARNREVDMLPAAAQTSLRAEYMDFSSPYLVFPGVIITKNDQQDIMTTDQLYGKEVVVVSGYVWHEMISLNHPDIDIVPVNSLIAGLRDVSMGFHDVLIATLPIALYYIDKEGITNLRVTGETGYYTKLSILTRNDWPILGSIMQKTLSNIPTHKKTSITKKWITIGGNTIFHSRYFQIIALIIISLGSIVILVIYIWNMTLRRIVSKRTFELEEDSEKRKKAEIALRRSEQKFREIFNSTSEAIFIDDVLSGKMVECNNRAVEMFGYDSKEEFLQTNYSNLTVDSVTYNMEAARQQVNKTLKEGPQIFDWLAQKKNGEDFWAEVSMRNFGLGDKNKVLAVVRNISKRKQAENILQNNENNFHDLVDNLLDGVVIVGDNDKHLYVNHRFVEMTGFSRKELLNMTEWDFTRTEDIHKLKQRIKKREESKIVKEHYERNITKKDGIEISVELSTTTTIWQGKTRQMVIFHNITERKKNEKALKESELNLRSIFDAMSDVIFEIDTTGKYLYIAPTSPKLLYKPAAEIIGKTLKEVYPKQKADEFLAAIHTVLKEKRSVKMQYTLKIGKIELWFDANITPKTKNSVIFVARDITELKRAEEIIKASESKFRAIFEGINDAVFVHPLKAEGYNNFIEVNDTACKRLGYKREELLKLSPSDISKSKDIDFQGSKKNRAKLELNNWSVFEGTQTTKKGKLIPVEISSNIFQLGNEKLIMTLARDITERNRAEEEINKKSIELKRHLEKSEKQRRASLVILNDLNKTTKHLKSEINERKRAEKIQRTLYNISNALNLTDNMLELYPQIRKFLGEIIDVTNFYVALYDEGKDIITLPYHVDEKGLIEKFPAGKTLTKYVLNTGKPLFATNEIVDNLRKKGEVETFGHDSAVWIGVPLKTNDKVIGIISVQSYDDPDIYSEKDIDILTFISEEIAQAIQKKQAEKALIDSEQLSMAVIEDSPLGISVRDKHGTLILHNKAWEQIWNYTEKKVKLSQIRRNKLNMNEKDNYLGEHIEKVKEIYTKGGTYLIPEVEIITGENKNIKWIRQRFYAIQNENNEVERVVILTSDISDWKKSVLVQGVLYSITHQVNKSIGLDQLYEVTQRELSKIISTQNFIIALKYGDSNQVHVVYSRDEMDGEIKAIISEKTLSSYVINTGEPLLVTEKEIAEMQEKGIIDNVGTDCKIWLGVPLILSNKPIGVIALQSYTNPDLFTERDMEILSFVSNEIALAIDNKQSEEQIRKNLREKETLLQEVYHRTKNNMAMVSAMLSMQSRRSDNEFVHTTFKEIRDKIRTMSLVHQKLYQSKDLSSINLKDYIKDLVNLLMASYGIKKEKVALTFDLKDVFVLIDVAIPLGLVLNELISNIFKHAFPHSKNDEISLKLFRDKDNDIHVLLSDNGKGVPQGLDLEKSQSMGLQTVFALIKDQMNGTVSYQTKNGLHWNFSIKDDMYKERI